jgi:hypothetical protein
MVRQFYQSGVHSTDLMNKTRKSIPDSQPVSPKGTIPGFLHSACARLPRGVRENLVPAGIFLLCFILYNTYTSLRMSGDTFPAGYLPFSIVYYHDLFLEHFANPNFAANAYAFANINGHLVSLFPIVTPVFITPFVFLCTWGMPAGQAILHVAQIGRTASAGIAALAACTFYLVIIRFVPKKIAILSTLIFAFATSTWSISSQALWQHGTIELFLLLMIYAILRNEEKPSSLWFVILGILSGLFVFCRPPDALLLLPILGYVVLLNRRYLAHYVFPGIIAGLPFLAYNEYYFGSIIGGYAQNIPLFDFSANFFPTFTGLLFSPNKGLFVFSPVLLLAFFGYFHIKSIDNKTISRLFFWFGPVLILETVLYGFFGDTGGGYSYGPRFLTSLVPVLCIYAAFFLSDTATRFRAGLHDYVKVAVIAVLIVFSVVVQFIGVFYFPYLDDSHYPQPWEGSRLLIVSSFQDGTANLDTFVIQSIPPLPPWYYYSENDEWKSLNIQKTLAAGDYQTAAWYYENDIQENPDSYILWNNLGACQIKLGEYEDALSSFNQSLEINPQFEEAGENQAVALQAIQQENTSAVTNTTVPAA